MHYTHTHTHTHTHHRGPVSGGDGGEPVAGGGLVHGPDDEAQLAAAAGRAGGRRRAVGGEVVRVPDHGAAGPDGRARLHVYKAFTRCLLYISSDIYQDVYYTYHQIFITAS
jgi:hypothetical protein